jgi:hypothetical protein
MRSDWLPGTSDSSGVRRHGCLVESRSPAEGDVRCAGRRVDLKRTGRRASGGRGILLREAAPPPRAGGVGGNSSDGSRISHSDDRSPPSPVVGAARGPACGEASHCNYKSQL